jgi:hypothetical protein
MPKKEKIKCNYCHKSGGKIKYFIIADDMENPRPYHDKCMDKFRVEVLIRLFSEKLED